MAKYIMRTFLLILIFCLSIDFCLANGSLSPNLIIESKSLGYSLNYRIYLPEIFENN